MKFKKRIPGLLMSAILLASLAACSSAPDALAKAEREVQKVYPEANIPEIDGLELQAAYKETAFSSSEALGGAKTEQDQQRKDSIVLLYAGKLGELEPETERMSESSAELLYGPYSGESKLWLTLSDLPVETAGAENRSVEGTDMQIARAGQGGLFATSRPDQVTYTLQTGSNSEYEEEELLGILAEVSR